MSTNPAETKEDPLQFQLELDKANISSRYSPTLLRLFATPKTSRILHHYFPLELSTIEGSPYTQGVRCSIFYPMNAGSKRY